MKTPTRGSRCGLCYWALYDGETCTNPECIHHGKAPESVVHLTNEEALTLINAKPKP